MFKKIKETKTRIASTLTHVAWLEMDLADRVAVLKEYKKPDYLHMQRKEGFPISPNSHKQLIAEGENNIRIEKRNIARQKRLCHILKNNHPIVWFFFFRGEKI